MSDDQIATALGEIKGELRAHRSEFQRYMENHDERHTKIDVDIKEHAAEINQAKGAKGAVLAMAAAVSTIVGLVLTGIQSFFRSGT